jgi:hypothetical protein
MFNLIFRQVIKDFKSRKYLNSKFSNWDILILILDKTKPNIGYKLF